METKINKKEARREKLVHLAKRLNSDRTTRGSWAGVPYFAGHLGVSVTTATNDLKSLVASGRLETKVEVSYPSRDWLQAGSLRRTSRQYRSVR